MMHTHLHTGGDCLLKAYYSYTGSPQGFSQIQIVHMSHYKKHLTLNKTHTKETTFFSNIKIFIINITVGTALVYNLQYSPIGIKLGVGHAGIIDLSV